MQMVDLLSQYLKIKEEVGAAWAEVLENGAFIRGAAVKEFEENLSHYLGGTRVVTCGNGTDALQIALMSLGLQPGDEVITTPFTFIATAEVIALLGVKPVFVDIDSQTFNMDVSQIEASITPRTKVILPVHLFGQCAEMEPLLAIARRHNLYVVEDACQAIGAAYTFSDGTVRMAGTMGTLGCTSFFPSKNLGCFGDGGALFTHDEKLEAAVACIANHGSVQKYHHERIGLNSRLDTLQAAVLNVKLRHLDEYTRARQAAAAKYDQLLSGCRSAGGSPLHACVSPIHGASRRQREPCAGAARTEGCWHSQHGLLSRAVASATCLRLLGLPARRFSGGRAFGRHGALAAHAYRTHG